MNANLKIDENDLKVLYSHTKGAYNHLTFEEWKDECKKSYISYFNNKALFNVRKYTYSQFVNYPVNYR